MEFHAGIATAAGRSAAELWSEADALATALDMAPLDTPDAVSDHMSHRMAALEFAALCVPIRTRADVVAKLRAVQLEFIRGEMAPEEALGATDAVIAWLETNA